MKITRVAVTGKCGALGARGLSGAASLASSSLTSAGKRLDPKNRERIVCRRVMGWEPIVILSIDAHEFVAGKQYTHQTRPGLPIPLVIGNARALQRFPGARQALLGV